MKIKSSNLTAWSERENEEGVEWTLKFSLPVCFLLYTCELSWAELSFVEEADEKKSKWEFVSDFFFFNYYFLERSFGFRGLRSNGSFFFFLFFFNFFQLLVVVIKENDNDVVVDILQNDDVSMLLCLSWLIHSYPFTTFIHSNSSYIYNEKRVVYNFIGFSFFIFNTT